MGRRRRWKSKGLPAPGPATHDADPVTRSIAVCNDRVAIASGRRWRIVDLREQTELHTDTSHDGAIRGVHFSHDGQHVLTCADDKTARTWATADWSCLRVLKAAKKASACAFSADGKHIFFSDRFGDVLTAATTPPAAADKPAADTPTATAAPAAEEPSLLLGHLQAIISSLCTCQSSSGQQLIISTDRDGKVRASVLPADPTKGSYEIQSYCLGHTNFVTCAAAVPRAAGSQQQLVLSGGGDGTVRLWDIDTGKQLAQYTASEQPPPAPLFQQQQEQQQGNGGESQQQQQQQQGNGDDDDDANGEDAGSSSGSESDDEGGADTTGGENTEPQEEGDSTKASKPNRPPIKRQQYAAVLNLAVSPDGTTVAAAVEGQQEVQILRISAAGGAYALQLQQKLHFDDVVNPAAVTFDAQGRLWVVGGVLRLDTESAHVGVAAKEEGGDTYKSVTSEVLSDKLRSYLECRVDREEADQAAGQSQIGYYHEGFKRKVYQRDENDPKKPRTHLKEAERLRALHEAEDKLKRNQGQQPQQQDAEKKAEQ